MTNTASVRNYVSHQGFVAFFVDLKKEQDEIIEALGSEYQNYVSIVLFFSQTAGIIGRKTILLGERMCLGAKF